jgi:tetratricopeptide (TPR) repeat protein
MNIVDHDRVGRIFIAAADVHNPLERQRVLEVECGDDDQLRAHVERLLHQDESTCGLDDPLNLTVVENMVAAGAIGEPQGRRLGNCRILARLGRGGMATVYRAAQEYPAREVALKVIDLDADSPEQRRRFECEAKALARLSHLGIASIYGAGIDDSRATPCAYIVMELVDGDRLDRHVRRHGLPHQRIAEIVASLCDAVHHAHQRGVIHRDLKPANIMVTTHGQCKVLDFGVARLVTSDGPSTLPGLIVGTPMYMSPEQVAGEADRIDIRTDIYAIGVILHQLLGPDQTPHSALEVGRRADDAPRELLLIASKAASVSPEDRYDSAAALANDLRRWLRHEPIAARPPSLSYVCGKWARRNPALLASLTLTVTATVAGLLLTAWQANVALQAEVRAAREARSAEGMLLFIERAFSAEDARERGPNTRVADLLDRATALNAEGNAEDPEAMARLASLFGRTYLALGLKHKARSQFDLAVAAFPDIRSEQAMTARTFLANALRKSGQSKEAISIAEAVYRDRLQLSGPEAPATIFALRSLGLAASESQPDRAEACLAQAAAACERVLGREHEQTLHTRADLAQVLIRSGRLVEGIQTLEPDYDLARRTLKPEHRTILTIALKLANALTQSGRAQDAVTICERHLRSAQSRQGPTHPITVGLRTEWAQANVRLGRGDVAMDGVKEAIRASDAAGDSTQVQAPLRRLLAQITRGSAKRMQPRGAFAEASIR